MEMKKAMSIIEKTKHDGMVSALVSRIDDLRFEITNKNFGGCRNGNRFICLKKATQNARVLLDEIDEAFEALKELEPSNE